MASQRTWGVALEGRRPRSRARPGPQALGSTTSLLMAMQRSAGNSAVATLVARQRSQELSVSRSCCSGGESSLGLCSTCLALSHGTDETSSDQVPVVARQSSTPKATGCPPYESGEKRASRTRSGHLSGDIWELGGGELLVADFGIGWRSVKDQARNDPALKGWLSRFENDSSYRLEVVGYDDCRGSARQHLHLRKGRASRVGALLGPAAKARTGSIGPAPPGAYVTSNESVGSRAQNRGVIIRHHQEMGFAPDVVKSTKRRTTPPTEDCNARQREELKNALPLAKAMVDNALSRLYGPVDAKTKVMLRKYFSDDSWKTKRGFIAGLKRIKSGLATSVEYECENPGSFMYDYFCDGATAYVRAWVGMSIHLCAAAFGRSNAALAETIIHEASHMFDFTDDEKYCSVGAGCAGLDRWDAYDNADSFSTFAMDLYING